jgi:hypothetical protein
MVPKCEALGFYAIQPPFFSFPALHEYFLRASFFLKGLKNIKYLSTLDLLNTFLLVALTSMPQWCTLHAYRQTSALHLATTKMSHIRELSHNRHRSFTDLNGVRDTVNIHVYL